MSGPTQLLQHRMSHLTATLYVLSDCSTVGPVLLQHCMSCLTATLYVLSYCSTVCHVLLQHCMFCLTAALYVPSYSTVCSVLLQPVKSQVVKISGHILAIHLPRSVIHVQSRCGKNISRPSLGGTVAFKVITMIFKIQVT